MASGQALESIPRAALLDLLIDLRVRALIPLLEEIVSAQGIQREVRKIAQRGRSVLR